MWLHKRTLNRLRALLLSTPLCWSFKDIEDLLALVNREAVVAIEGESARFDWVVAVESAARNCSLHPGRRTECTGGPRKRSTASRLVQSVFDCP